MMGLVHSAVRFERSEGVEAEVVNDGLGPVGVAVFAQSRQNRQSQQDGQTEEHHGIQSYPNSVHCIVLLLLCASWGLRCVVEAGDAWVSDTHVTLKSRQTLTKQNGPWSAGSGHATLR